MGKNKHNIVAVRYCVGWSFDGLLYATHYVELPNNKNYGNIRRNY